MESGPTQFIKLHLPEPIQHMHSHPSYPFLLLASSNSFMNYNTQHQIPVKEVPLTEISDRISFLGYANKTVFYSASNYLRANGMEKLYLHKDPIRHLQADDYGIVLTASRSAIDKSIKISHINRERESPPVVGEFNFHYEPVSSMIWHNSLAISGDCRGDVCLWDINKCQTILHRKAHYEAIEYVGAYVDFTLNNVFYTVAPSEKRIIFSDLRTNKPIKIIDSLHSDTILDILCTPSGKGQSFIIAVLIVFRDIVAMVDINSYSLLGSFTPAVSDTVSQMKWTSKTFSFDNIRSITRARVSGKYAIIGCDNGCIQVYDTDLNECLYGFGLVKFGPIKELCVNKTRQEVFGLDQKGEVYLARFGKPFDD